MRCVAFHRSLSRLALVAALLLATLPTLGRLASHAHVHVDAQAAHAHAASHSMAMARGHAMAPEPVRKPGPAAPVPHAHGLDCAYCALLAGALPTARLASGVPLPLAMGLVPGPAASTPVADACSPGLGARGPPRLA